MKGELFAGLDIFFTVFLSNSRYFRQHILIKIQLNVQLAESGIGPGWNKFLRAPVTVAYLSSGFCGVLVRQGAVADKMHLRDSFKMLFVQNNDHLMRISTNHGLLLSAIIPSSSICHFAIQVSLDFGQCDFIIRFSIAFAVRSTV